MSEEHDTNNNNLKAGSNLEKLLRQGKFVVTSELGPPRGASREAVEKKAELLKGYADAFNLTDCQTAMVRLSSIASGAILLNMGMEPVVQLTCRDRNRIAMQSDILGAAALGMKNLLCLTGDHQCFGDHPEAKGVFDLDSINQLDMFRQMRDEKKFQSGEELKTDDTKLFLAARLLVARRKSSRYRALPLAVRIDICLITTYPIPRSSSGSTAICNSSSMVSCERSTS